MDIMNADYAKGHFPCQLWDAGEKCLTLSNFEWDEATQTMLYGQTDYPYGEPLCKPVIEEGNPTRLYGAAEIDVIMRERGMAVKACFSDFFGAQFNAQKSIQLMVFSCKQS